MGNADGRFPSCNAALRAYRVLGPTFILDADGDSQAPDDDPYSDENQKRLKELCDRRAIGLEGRPVPPEVEAEIRAAIAEEDEAEEVESPQADEVAPAVADERPPAEADDLEEYVKLSFLCRTAISHTDSFRMR